MSAEPYELRGRKIYQEDERVKLNPGDAAQVNRRQLRAMQDAVGRARAEGRLTIAEARSELSVLTEIRRQLNGTPRPIGIRLSAADQEFSVRKKATQKQRNQRRAEKQARTAARPAKKSKSRKRR